MITKTDIAWLKVAYKKALLSGDLSTQNGAIICNELGGWVGGCNDILPGVEDTAERRDRPAKYVFTEHAERRAVYQAARCGVETEGATMYCPWFACDSCGRAIIASGIKRVVGHQKMFDATPDHWKSSIADALTMLTEAGVEMELVQGDLGVDPIRFNGELWYP